MYPINYYEPEINLVSLGKYIRKYSRLIILISLFTGIIFFIYRFSQISVNLASFPSQYEAYETAFASYQEKSITYQQELADYETAKKQLSSMITSLPNSDDKEFLEKVQVITNYIVYGNPVAPVEPAKVKVITEQTEIIQCIKYLVVSAIICAFLIILLLSCRFVFSDTLKDEADLQHICGNYVIGDISEELTIQKLTHIIESGQSYQIISSMGKDMCSQFAGSLPEKSLSIGNPETDIEAAKAFDPLLPIVLIEQVGKSKNKQISQLVRFLNSAHSELLGCITVAQR